MRLNEIQQFNNTPEQQTTNTRPRITDEEMELVYGRLRRNEMSKAEIQEFAKAMVEGGKYQRSVGSLVFLMERMHILMHGSIPDGETSTWVYTFLTSDLWDMRSFIVHQGDLNGRDIRDNVAMAKKQYDQIVAEKTRKASLPNREAAMQMMSEFYRKNKQFIKPDVAKFREQIIADIMSGKSTEESFAPFKI